jgi:acyl-homoserine lactone acylase PvdQ
MPSIAKTSGGAALLLVALSTSQSPAQSRTTIYRDDWGVPHIYAPTPPAGFYAFGYAMAEDQLDYLLTLTLLARGELAAALGPTHVATDVSSRLWRHAEESKLGFAKMAPELQANYGAFVAGASKWMTENPAKVPAWAPRLEPWDPVAISRWLLWLAYQAGEGLADCRRGGVKLAAADLTGLEHRDALASNEWVLHPWRTAENVMMVLSDPHGGVDGQFVYELRMHAGPIEFAGYAMGAMPLLVSTPRVAWGMTTGAPDVADCYEIETDPANPRRFLFDGKPQRITSETTVIGVKDGRPVTRVMEYARLNGVLSPIVARVGTKAYAVSTSYMHDAGIFDDEVYRMVQAPNAEGVREAMKTLGMFPQNVMVGDRTGHSFYLRAGKAPKRPAGFDWSKPVPGNASSSGWLGIHPLEDLVQISDPATGYMQNNNIAPDQMLVGSPLTKDRYPDYLFHDLPGRSNSRGRRAIEALSGAYRFTTQDAIDLALDEKWMDTDRWRLGLERSLARDPARAARLSPAAKTVADRILRFDGQGRAGSAAALSFWWWRAALANQPGGLPLEVVEPAFLAADSIRAPLADRFLAALDSAVATMTRQYGGIDKTLGDAFRIGRSGASSWPVGGVGLTPGDLSKCEGLASWNHICVMTLRAFTPGPPDSLNRRLVTIGSRLLRLTIFTDPVQIYTIHNFGQSGRSDSPHYDDQVAKLTSLRQVKPAYFEKADLMRHLKSERTLDVPPI